VAQLVVAAMHRATASRLTMVSFAGAGAWERRAARRRQHFPCRAAARS
jgi:hypothetical protein